MNKNIYNHKISTSEITDYGPQPCVCNIYKAVMQNCNYRTALWTGSHLQFTLMSIEVGGNIGLEMHSDLDQVIRIEEGYGLVKMGSDKENLNYQKEVDGNYAIIIPAGTWHNLINTGSRPLKLYCIYTPPAYPYGTVHETKETPESDKIPQY